MLKTLAIKNNLTKINFSDGSGTNRIKYIVIHYFGSLGTAYNVSEFFRSAYRGASAHLSLDETKTVWRSVEDKNIAWHCGAKSYVHPLCRNSNSIGIEVRPYILDKSQSGSASYKGWYFSDEIENNLVELVKHYMELYKIPKENVIRHYDVTGKWCPRPYMGTDVNLYYNEAGEERWRKFLAKLDNKDAPSDWAKEAWEKATKLKVIDGTRPQGEVTREQLVVVLDRLNLLK